MAIIGLLHPGEMGAAIGATLRTQGHTVLWASQGRSAATARRAVDAGLEDAGDVAALATASHVILSICPPHAAFDVAHSLSGYGGIYCDANAISPAAARLIASQVSRYADGGIVGPPPARSGTTRLFLSGPETASVADLFAGTKLDVQIVSEDTGAASAVKMAYAAWTKGSAALLLAIRALARSEGIEPALLTEWEQSQPQLAASSEQAARSALGKGWRWVGEMHEIAETFDAVGLPDGFHRAAADIYARSPHSVGTRDPVTDVLDALLVARAGSAGPT